MTRKEPRLAKNGEVDRKLEGVMLRERAFYLLMLTIVVLVGAQKPSMRGTKSRSGEKAAA